MIELNPRTGELFKESELLDDSRVLYYITHSITITEALKESFTLLSIKRLLSRYPSLMRLTDWTDNFMAQAARVEPRIGIIRDASKAYAPSEIQYLHLEMRTATAYTELTGHAMFDDGPFRMEYEDKPHMSVNAGVSLSGYSAEGLQSLSYTPIREVFYLPIRMVNDKVVITHTPMKEVFYLPIKVDNDEVTINHNDWANELCNKLDFTRQQRYEHESEECSISLLDMLMSIMMDLNLDDEDDRLRDIEMLKGRVETLPREENPETDGQ